LSFSATRALTSTISRPAMRSVGTQTDPWVCPDCNGNPDLEEEKFVFNELACTEDYLCK
jgi:hypothetical protein